MRFFLLLLLASYTQLSMAIGLAEIELKSHLGETLQAHLAVVDLPPNTNANCFSIADMSETGPLQTITLSLQTNPNGLQLILSSADVLLEPIINVRLSYACEPKLERDYTLLLDPAPDQGPIIQEDGLLTTTAAYAANRVAVTSRSAATLGKKHTPKGVATAPAKSHARQDSTWESAIDEKLLAAYTGKPSQDNTSKIMPPPASASSKPTKPATLIISAAPANDSSQPVGLSLRLSKSIDSNRPPALPTASADMDESTAMANRLAYMDKQIAALQERNRVLQAQAKIRPQESTYLSSPAMLSMALLLASLGLAWWLHRRMVSRQVKAQQTVPLHATFAEPRSLIPESATPLVIEEITMPTVHEPHSNQLKAMPLVEDASWDFSESTTQAVDK